MFRGIVAAAAAALWLAAGAASAELAKWDQQRVAKYAEELETATGELRRALEKLPIQQAATQQRAFYQVRDTMRLLDRASAGLAEALKKGEGMEETHPRFKRILLLRDDAVEQGRRADIPNDVMDKVTPAGTALLKLRPYYESEPAPGAEPKAP
jgi:hypothetical protein